MPPAVIVPLPLSSHLARFGVFELDLRARELRKAGVNTGVPEQSIKILELLLEKPGELVMREEIRKKLWPNDTVVEFDHSINAAIKRLRQALGDPADDPQWIETLARRGYRWKASVDRLEVQAHATEVAGVVSDTQNCEIAGESLIGKKVSHYVVLEVLGGGGMGVVFKAEDLKLGRRVALKFLPRETASDPLTLKRFEREARAASALNHPNICTVYEIEEDAGRPFIVMELLEGQTLRELIDVAASQSCPLPMARILDLATQITAGLDAAHRGGIIHRDIKPANIFVTSQAQSKILDFGLAQVATLEVEEHGVNSVPPKPGVANTSSQLSLSQPGFAMGTAGYMSPEQVRGETLDPRTDIFSLGVVLYEMATGHRASNSGTASSGHDLILGDATRIRDLDPKVSTHLEAIIVRAMQSDREARYSSAAEMLQDIKRLRDVSHDTHDAALQPSIAEVHRISRTQSWLAMALVAVAAVLFAIMAGYYVRHRHGGRLTEKDSIVLADFVNSTGDAIFDDTLKPALRSSLQQSPFLNVLPDSVVSKTLALMSRPATSSLTPEIAREVCIRAGSKAYITGAIAALGSDYVIALKAVNCLSGQVLSQHQVTVEGKDKILNALSNTSTQLRERLGESLLTVGKFDVPLDQTTPSLEALREYNLGMKAGNNDEAATLPYLLRAIQFDPNFAMAYLATAETYTNLNQGRRATEYYIKAFQLRDHANAREKLEIESTFYQNVTGDLEKAAQTYQKIIERHPEAPTPIGNLGTVYWQQGRYEKATDLARQALRFSPIPGGEEYQGIAEDLIPLQSFDEAQQILHTALDRKVDIDGIHKDLYGLGFLKGDTQAMAEHSAWLVSRPEYANLGYSLQSDTEAYVGHLGKARDLSARAVDAGERTDNKEVAALWSGNAALREGLFGNTAQARRYAREALRISQGSEHVEIVAALAFAMAGDIGRAESLERDLAKLFPLDSQLQSVWIPIIEAQIALVRTKPLAAIDRLKSVSPVELGAVPFSMSISCLYAVYLRGEAYLATQQGNAAAREFQKILIHDGIVWNCPTGALARLGLGRANALEARAERGAAADAARTRARTAYQDFLALWKDADSDIPILKQAKAEYAKLR